MSPSASTSGWPGSVRSGPTVTRPAAVDLDARTPRRASRPARDAVTPAAQITVRVVDALGLAVRVADRDRLRRRRRRPCGPTSGVTPSCSSAAPPSRESDSGKLVSTRSAASTSRTRARPRVDGAEVAAQRVARELGDLARHLDAGRAGADDDEREPGPPALRVGLDLGRLEGAEDAAADLERAVERLQLGRARLPVVVAEVRVVANRRRRRACRRRACTRASPLASRPRMTRRARGRSRSPRRAARGRSPAA